MKLSYNVLWVDDNIESIAKYKEKLDDLNKKIGIKTDHEDQLVEMGAREAPDVHRNRIQQELESKLKEKVFELIIVDLHMTGNSGGFDGSDIIEFIRETQRIFRPIIFHSAGNPTTQANAANQLNDSARNSGIFGKSVFISTKIKLPNLLKDIVGEMHENEHKINQVRGALMDCVSEIDAQIIEMIMGEAIWERVPEASRNKALNEFKKLTRKQLKDLCAQYKHIRNMTYEEVRDYIIKNPEDVNTLAKTKLLRELARSINGLQEEGKALSAFIHSEKDQPECLSRIRNKYAHQTAEQLGANHNNDHCTYIREQAHKHLNNVLSLKKKLS